MIIGIGHEMRQGKDEVANYIAKTYGFKKVSFAKALKEELALGVILIMYNMDNNDVFLFDQKLEGRTLYNKFSNGDLLSKFSNYMMDNYDERIGPNLIKRGSTKKDRELLQLWGTDYRRNYCSKHYWVKKLHDFVTSSGYENIVISDIRFLNEASYVLYAQMELGEIGFTINVSGRKYQMEGVAQHRSEVELKHWNYDYYIHNVDSFGFLFDQVDGVMEKEKIWKK